MTRLYYVVFVSCLGLAEAQFQGFEAPVFTGSNFGFKQTKSGNPGDPSGDQTKDDNAKAINAATEAIEAKVKAELKETRGTVQQLKDRFEQQDKEAITIKGKVQEVNGKVQEVNEKVKSLTENLQSVAKESEERNKAVQKKMKEQCLVTAQLQAVLGNTATGKPTFTSATSSSTKAGAVATRAIDGNTNPMFLGGSCTHTSSRDSHPWWLGHLSAKIEVHNITLTNRRDCCANRLKNVIIEGFEEDPTNNPEAQPHLCKKHPDQVQATETIQCDSPIAAHFIRISLGYKGYLTLCEVNVGGVTLERKGFALQSSVVSPSTNAKMATDDDVSTCSVTGSETGDAPWWQMDLNGAVTVLSVEITNRNDDKYTWLSNIQIDLYDQLPSSCSGDTEVTRHKCTFREEQVGRGETVTLTCDTPMTGRYLRITKMVKLPSEAFSLCEVTVNTLPSA
ncbi:uncharacterized protein LOC124140612 isoform X1 [Haliotis rufescens]|uniref:uncharacterized protein LOC124140612 isoform X1 n=1 Tax=Haliotis rufescens TaxID=6454 RepID=UPI00201ED250|nr:uncharacterized protein LOC124140612 isoform X1 [Haliotis rufescens]